MTRNQMDERSFSALLDASGLLLTGEEAHTVYDLYVAFRRQRLVLAQVDAAQVEPMTTCFALAESADE